MVVLSARSKFTARSYFSFVLHGITLSVDTTSLMVVTFGHVDCGSCYYLFHLLNTSVASTVKQFQTFASFRHVHRLPLSLTRRLLHFCRSTGGEWRDLSLLFVLRRQQHPSLLMDRDMNVIC